MEPTAFKKNLFRAAFSAMACDGEIHENEVSELQEMAGTALYFDGLDHEQELQGLVREIKQKGSQFIQDFFDLLGTWELKERQEFQLLEVLIRIIEADQKIEPGELHFLHNVQKHLSISDQQMIVKFPRHIHLLVGLDQHGNTKIKTGLHEVDFGGLDDLFKPD